MEELLGKDGATGTVGAELTKITEALTGAGGIKELIDTASKANQPATLNVSAKFNDLKTAVEKATEAIDGKLESGDLTRLDTSNLKVLRISINDIQNQIQSAFEDVNLKFDANNPAVTTDAAKKLLTSLESGAIKSNTELGEKAVGVSTSSQKQAETISEMRDQLRGFAANPKAAGLESVNFTGYLETVDAALSNISDQRAKLGASQNETATSSKAKVDDLLKEVTGATGTLKTEIDKITAELDETQATSLAGKIKAATVGAALDIKDAYGKLEKAVTESIKLIDEALESNDLTELDTTNLKALRSYITETKATFDASAKESGFEVTANPAKTPTKEQIAKLQAGSNSAAELGKTATEKSTATHKFSQNQPETVADMRAQLKTFAADPSRRRRARSWLIILKCFVKIFTYMY